MQGTGRGCFVFSWDQVELDGLAGSPPAPLHVGSSFRWAGRALRIDDPGSVLRLVGGPEHEALREQAARQVRRIFPAARARGPDPMPDDDDLARCRFELTDGLGHFRAVLIERGSGRAPLVMFRDGMPSPDREYWIMRVNASLPEPRPAGAMICFVPGTLLDTPDGPRPVEEIHPGDRVFTRDDGAQEVLWRASRRISGGRMIAMPELRPIRLGAGVFGDGLPQPALFVSPDHRMLVTGPAARDLFGETEVLVAARDLVGLPGVSIDRRPRPVDYVHLMLARHQVLTANGLACESFHPGHADLSKLDRHARAAIEALHPGLGQDPMKFGEFARRMLSRAEAALVLHGQARLVPMGH